MNDYISCTKNNGSLKSNRKLLSVKHLQSNTRDNFVAISLIMLLWWKLRHEILPKQGLWHESHTLGS